MARRYADCLDRAAKTDERDAIGASISVTRLQPDRLFRHGVHDGDPETTRTAARISRMVRRGRVPLVLLGLGISVAALSGCASSANPSSGIPGSGPAVASSSSPSASGDGGNTTSTGNLSASVLAKLQPPCADIPDLKAIDALTDGLTSAYAKATDNYGNPSDPNKYGGFHIDCAYGGKNASLSITVEYMYHVDGFVQNCENGHVAGLPGAKVDPAGPGRSSTLFTLTGAGGSQSLYDTCTNDAEIILNAELDGGMPATDLPDATTLRATMAQFVANEQGFQAAAKKITIR